ncbi:MAG: DUF1573 domain-containing protein [Thermoguttaceae bacterium]
MRLAIIPIIFILSVVASCRKHEPSENVDTAKPTPVTKNTLKKTFFLKHDFGTINEGEVLNCTLELKNDTVEPLHFGHSQTSCGACLSVKSMPNEILPNETGIFELEFNTSGKRGSTPQNAAFWDGEPKTILAVVDTTAVVRALWTDPATVSFGNLSTNQPQQTKLYIMAAGHPDAEVVSSESFAPWVTLTSDPVETSAQLKSQSIKAIDYYEIEWTGKDASPGTLASKLVFHVKETDTAEPKTLEVPVVGYLSGDVEIIPSQLVFGRISSDKITRKCTLNFAKPIISATKILCQTDHPCVQAELVSDSKNPSQYILNAQIEPSPDITEPLIEGTITGTDESGAVIFSVPYVAFFDKQ